MAETTPSIAAQVVGLTKLSVPELRLKWREVFGEETKQRHRQFLIKRLAWRLQADAFGHELSAEAKQRLDELQQEFRDSPPETWFRGAKHNKAPAPLSPKGPPPVRSAKSPKPGTVLARDYKGERVTVRVIDGGYEWRGNVYKSLSAVAKAITGSHCSGVAFFKTSSRKGGSR